MAQGLQSLSVGAELRVGILLNNSIEYIAAYFGIQKTGATVVPLNNFLKAVELEYIIQDSGLKLLISEMAFEETLISLAQKVSGLKIIYTDQQEAELSWSKLIANRDTENLNGCG